MAKIHYFLKLNPPRTSFMNDMSAEEKSIMQKHVNYWKPYVKDETVIVLGPVFDPKGGYGIAVVAVESENHLISLLAGDPANGLNKYEYFPMKAESNLIDNQ
jgi:uncharacterized protein